MPDPSVPLRLRGHADTYRLTAHAVLDVAHTTRWRSLAADAMQSRAGEVAARLVATSRCLDDAAAALDSAHRCARHELAILRSDLTRASTSSPARDALAAALARGEALVHDLHG